MSKQYAIWPVHPRLCLGSLLLCCCCLAMPLSAADDIPALSTTLTAVEPVDAPDFSLDDMDGDTHTLSDLRGHYVLVNFWATWCPPCRKEMPSLEFLYQRYRERSLRVLAVNQWEDSDHVFSYMGELEVFPAFPILFDRQSAVADLYGVKGLPTSFLVDPEGRIVYRAVGGREFDHPAVIELLDALLPAAAGK